VAAEVSRLLMSDLKEKTVTGVYWSLSGKVGKQFIVFVASVILARLLSPFEFGLLAMVTVITNFANIYSDLGFGSAVIQAQKLEDIHLSSVFWLNILGGTLLTFLFISAAPLVASFYEVEILYSITIALSFNYVIRSFQIIQRTLLRKELDFKIIAIVDLTSILLASTTAIALAANGFGVWSLVTNSLLTSFIASIMLWYMNDWRPQFRFSWTKVKELLHFSLNLLGTETFGYWTRNLDNLLIGKYLSSSALGIYGQAYRILLFPVSNISGVLSQVFFPSFSKIQDETNRIKKYHLKLTRSVALVTFPLMMGLLGTAEPFVLTFFGYQWEGMIPILQVFSILGINQSIMALNGNLYLSQGRADLQFKIGVILRIVIIAGIVLGLQWGILGVAIGYAIASIINIYPNFYFAGGLVNLSFSELAKNLAPVFAISSSMLGIIIAVKWFLLSTFENWLQLLILVGTGGFSYLLMIIIFKLKAYHELKDLLLSKIKNSNN